MWAICDVTHPAALGGASLVLKDLAKLYTTANL